MTTTAKRFLRLRRALAMTVVCATIAAGVACRDIYSSVEGFATICTDLEFGSDCPGDDDGSDGSGDGSDDDEYGDDDDEYGDGDCEYGDGDCDCGCEYGDGDCEYGSDGREYGECEYGDDDCVDGDGECDDDCAEGESDSDCDGGTPDAGVDAGSGSGSADASVCTDAGMPPHYDEMRRALECVAVLNQARSAYHDMLTAMTAGYPLAASNPTNGPSPTLSMMAGTMAPPKDIFGIPDAVQDAFYKSQNFEGSFYVDRVINNPSLMQCTQVLAALPMGTGYFGAPPTSPPPPPPLPDPNVCFNNPQWPPQPPHNCMGVVVVAFDGYNAGELDKNGTEKCEDFTKHFAVTASTRNTGVVAGAFGGIRKEAKKGENGPDCSQASPLLQNWEMGIAAKVAGVFVPELILEQKVGQAPQWVSNEKGKMLYFIYPDNTGKPVKHGPICRQDTQLTVRTVADMHLPYYIHARVFEDPSGKSFRSKAYEARITTDQRCYGPGTLVANPNAFAVVPSEHEHKASLKIVRDCQQEQAWNANFNLGATMGANQAGSFGFAGGVTETIRCAVQLDIDQFAEGGCFANQNFGNVAMTTRKLNGPFAIGSVYPLFNPSDPNQGTAPFNFLQMGMKIIGGQTRATSSIDNRDLGTGGDGLATIFSDRKKLTDKPEAARAKVKMGSTGCALLVGADGNPRPANECVVPFADWPFLPKIARNKVPTAGELNDLFDKLVKQIKDAAAR